MYTIAVFSPFIGSLLAGLTGRWLGARGSATISILGLITSFVLSLCLCYEVGIAGSTVYVPLGQWFSASSIRVNWGLYFDTLSVCMMFTVTLVSACVHLYSVSYMQNDPHLPRFMSYLSLFTGFMLIRVTAPHMVQMLVGWEGIYQCLNGLQPVDSQIHYSAICAFLFGQKRFFYFPRLPAKKRQGSHTFLFLQRLYGFCLGHGWLEKHGQGVRCGIYCSVPYKDVADFYRMFLYGLGYVAELENQNPLKREKKPQSLPYYQIRTFTFHSLICFYDFWYPVVYGPVQQHSVAVVRPRIKRVPDNLESFRTPLCLAIWVMGDGSGMQDGGFKRATHSFSKAESEFLCDILQRKYNFKVSVILDGKSLWTIRIWKRSVPSLYEIVSPFLKPSCEYKFRFVNQNSIVTNHRIG